MPRYPDTSFSVQDIGGSVFTALAHKLASFEGEVFPFHVGDTWLEPPEGCRMEDLSVASHPGMHRYTQPHGHLPLLDALSARLEQRNGVETTPANILITTGATGGLGAIMGALVEPGDEVLLVAPFWPLISGIVRSFHGTPVAVPILQHVDSPEAAVELLQASLTERTMAIYVNTPNNPTGRVLPRPWLEAIVEWAARNDLWIVADEVYEDLVYEGEHTHCRSLAPERVFAAHSFSKAYAMAGNRCGWVVGPRNEMVELQKIGTHSFYSTPTASQLLAVNLLDGRGARWIVGTRELYRRIGSEMATALGIDPPQGSTFLFFDAAPHLDERGLEGFLSDLADEGVFLAPGTSFGPYPTWVRVCFTAAPPEVTRRGIAVLAEALGRA